MLFVRVEMEPIESSNYRECSPLSDALAWHHHMFGYADAVAIGNFSDRDAVFYSGFEIHVV